MQLFSVLSELCAVCSATCYLVNLLFEELCAASVSVLGDLVPCLFNSLLVCCLYFALGC